MRQRSAVSFAIEQELSSASISLEEMAQTFLPHAEDATIGFPLVFLKRQILRKICFFIETYPVRYARPFKRRKYGKAL
jgi:hypothetical protein